MTISAEDMYRLLPSIYRIRDAQQGEPLKALLGIVAEQLALVEKDIDHLYDNWFIETCDEWLVPYIGDLLGVHPFHPSTAQEYSMRAYVANTLAYRRRKGTLSVLEQLAHDVTGWPAKAVEFFQLLAASQQVNHVRPGRGGTLRVCGNGSRDSLELLGGPFEDAAHTADVRRMKGGRGKYNIPNIGLFLWRQQAYAVKLATPGKVEERDGCYTFDPFGRDIALFMPPQTEGELLHLAEEINVPGKLRRWPLFLEAQLLRKGGKSKRQTSYFELPVLSIVSADYGVVEPGRIAICDLEGWPNHAGGNHGVLFAVDPLLGRLQHLGASGSADHFRLSYSYGFSADIGGGPYDRHRSVQQWYQPDPKQPFWQLTVNASEQSSHPSTVRTLGEAVERWNSEKAGSFGVITISDSSTYQEADTLEIRVPQGSTLAIVAAGWLADKAQGRDGIMVPDQLSPHLKGNVTLSGDGGVIVLDGLWIEGHFAIAEGKLSKVGLGHCSVVLNQVPAALSIANNDDLILTIDHCITGPVLVNGDIGELQIADSLIDGGSESAFAINAECSAARTVVDRSTFFGRVHVTELTASEAIFASEVWVDNCQSGCLRFSYLPVSENPDQRPRTPRRFRCQPSLEIADAMELRERSRIDYDRNQLHKEIISWLKPSFVSTSYGDPAYGQLSPSSPMQIRAGAEDGSEMGVYCHLKQPQREANLRTALDEYLRAGLEAGIFFIDETRREKEKPS